MSPRRSLRPQRDLGCLTALQIHGDRLGLLVARAGVRLPPQDIPARRHVLEGHPVLDVDVPGAAVLPDGLAALGLDLDHVSVRSLLAGEIHRDADAGGFHHLQLDVALRRGDRLAPSGAAVARPVEPARRLAHRYLFGQEAAFYVSTEGIRRRLLVTSARRWLDV